MRLAACNTQLAFTYCAEMRKWLELVWVPHQHHERVQQQLAISRRHRQKRVTRLRLHVVFVVVCGVCDRCECVVGVCDKGECVVGVCRHVLEGWRGRVTHTHTWAASSTKTTSKCWFAKMPRPMVAVVHTNSRTLCRMSSMTVRASSSPAITTRYINHELTRSVQLVCLSCVVYLACVAA